MNTNFGELSGNIRERQNRIRILQAETPRLLEPDEKLKVIVAPEHKQRALEIAKELKRLREKNEKDAAILEKAEEIARRYSVPLDELHQLSLSIPYLEKQIAELELQVENHKKSDIKKFALEKDSQISRIGQTCQKLKDARVALGNHQAAKKEIEALMQGIEPEEAR